MKRLVGMTLFTSALIVAVLAAQEEPAPAKKDDAPAKAKKSDLPEIKGLEKKEPGEAPALDNDPDRVKKILERLNKNMDTSEERLAKKDPGTETRKIQDDIVKDLDELIKQQNQGGGGGGGGGAMGDASKGGAAGGGTAKRKLVKSRSKSGQGSQANNKDNAGGDSKKGKPSTANQEKKKDGEDKLAKDKLGKDKLGKDKEELAKKAPQ